MPEKVIDETLVESWLKFGNGDFGIAVQIISPAFVAHAAPYPGNAPKSVAGLDGIKQWITWMKSILGDLKFTMEMGPIINESYFVFRWRANGTYKGGFPGASAAVGKPITFTGMDMLRVKDNMIVEYWANTDSLLFIQELGVSKIPG